MSSCMAGPSGGDEDKARGNMVTSSGYSYFEPNSSEIYHMNNPQMEMIGFPMDSSWNQHHQIDEDPSNMIMRSSSSSSSVLFPCEGNERPSQGLSLSLSSSNPSTIGLQSFELRQPHEDLRFGPSSSSIQQGHTQIIKYSKYLGPAQELLNEFCNLGEKANDKMKKVVQKSSEWQNDESTIKKLSISPLDLLELQRRKTKLILMLEEVDRRYKHYCDRVKSVVSSFETVAGNGSATVYSALASKAMSRHFRCLRDGIVCQIKATKKAMGEKGYGLSPGTSKDATPRLRVLDQTLRQQRAFQQMSMMESHPWRPQRGLPERSVSVLRAWLFEHFLHPYPSDVDKHILARQTGLSRSQVSNWFINARVRLWKPMVEEMYIEELKDQEGGDGALDLAGADLDETYHQAQQNQNPSRNEDEKPTHDQLIRIDSECLSSIINNPGKNNGGMELDFSSYNAGGGGAVSYGGGGGVSLTLGLHQHGGNGGVSLAFSPASQGSLFQYSLLESESQTLPYRNLMGAQLLHDLAG